MKSSKIFLAVVLSGFVLFIAGCASVTNSEMQQVGISTRDKAGLGVAGANCLWKNTKGEGQFQTPAVVLIRRDYAALQVVCKKEGFPDAMEAFKSKSTSAMFGNILAGGPIGMAFDHSSGAAYDYPPTLTIWFPAQTQAVQESLARKSEVLAEKSSQKFLPSGYAKLEDVDAVPFINDKGRERYREWLTKPTPRAFAISSTGAYGWTTGLKAPEESLPADPVERAVEVCKRNSKAECKLYAVNGAVVWIAPPAKTALGEVPAAAIPEIKVVKSP